MDLSDRNALKVAIENIAHKIGTRPDVATIEDYLNGHVRNAHLYEKYADRPDPFNRDMPTLWRYLLAAEGYLHQPSLYHHYDVFQAARAIPLIRALDRALSVLPATTRGSEEKLEQIARAKTMDILESALFEIITAAAYQSTVNSGTVQFVETSSTPSPDLLVTSRHGEWAIECKKYDRHTEVYGSVRNTLRDKLSPVLAHFYKAGQLVRIEVEISEDPDDISSEEILKAALSSYPYNLSIVTPQFILRAKQLPTFDTADYLLFPSPRYYDLRYQFRTDSDWQGLVNFVHGEFAGPSFLDPESISWEGVAIWKIKNPKIIWKKRKLNFKTIFDGIGQLRDWGDRRFLHVMFERDISLQSREDILGMFAAEFSRRHLAHAGNREWVAPIFNEISFLLTVDGFFYLDEFAHFDTKDRPPVQRVFTIPAQ